LLDPQPYPDAHWNGWRPGDDPRNVFVNVNSLHRDVSPRLLYAAVGADLVDRTLPPGRPLGPTGPATASKGFLAAVPDLKVTVVERLVVGDRVVSHPRGRRA
jgi:SnoaL-like polyketide cyclase